MTALTSLVTLNPVLLAGSTAAGRTGQTNNRLLAFERGTFNLIEELEDLGQGGVQKLREQLASDDKECSEKIKRLLHQHYQAFISASKVCLSFV